MNSEPGNYVGRFAPSPSGPLHFGSLLASVASYAQARVNNGRWLVRIEDIDPPRQTAGADQLIISTLAAFGFEWDDSVSYQSTSLQRHEERVARLMQSGDAYECSCSRRDLTDVARGPLGVIYPGTCRTGCSATDVSIRARTDDVPVTFVDGLQGRQSQRLESETGDFVIKRRDGLIAYHLAVVSDDFDQGITEIVRGIDLIDSTPRQIHLQRQLGMLTPDYLHIPVAVNNIGQKLSKLTGATAISVENPTPVLFAAFQALGQKPPALLAQQSVASIWQWALANWDVGPLRALEQVEAGQFGFG